MNDPFELWSKLRETHRDRVDRVSAQFNPTHESLQDFINRLSDLEHAAAVANEKCGTVGNPYEQPADDLGVLLCAAEKLTGLSAVSRRDRP